MEFIREKIKEKPINKKRIAKQMGIAALCGGVFALTTCIVVLIFMPVLRSTFLDGMPGNQQGITPGGAQSGDSNIEENTEDTSQPGGIIPDFNLSLEDYQELQNQLYKIGSTVNKSIVTIRAIVEKEEDINQSDVDTDLGSGVIIDSDENYYYVLTEKKFVQDAPRLRVGFMNQSSADATLLKYDGNTGIAILAVEKRQIDKTTQRTITVAKVANSYAIGNGTIVIALGNPLGTNYSILTGNITSADNEVMTLDNNYDVFTTDIVASKYASGVIVNTNGEIVGMVIQDFSYSNDIHTLTAVSISEITGIIDKLVSGNDIPYLGLYVSTITDQIAQAYDLPKGVFIRDVLMDSPAMLAGLQSGDVITHINGEEIYTDFAYSDKLQKLIPGTTCEVTVQRQNGNAYVEIKCEVEIGVLK